MPGNSYGHPREPKEGVQPAADATSHGISGQPPHSDNSIRITLFSEATSNDHQLSPAIHQLSIAADVQEQPMEVETTHASSGSMPGLSSTDLVGAGAPLTNLAGAAAPSTRTAGAVASLLQSQEVSTSMFSYANIVARQHTAEATAAAADSVASKPLPPPMALRKRPAAQLTLRRTTSNRIGLPGITPIGSSIVTRGLSSSPYAGSQHRRIPRPSRASCPPRSVDKGGGYFSSRFGTPCFRAPTVKPRARSIFCRPWSLCVSSTPCTSERLPPRLLIGFNDALTGR
ncbi:unnamed protein product [Heligmosomoides polygyrus]|uniref:Uncharacterized protein n=1 Tax=Heligmosomoides polygyrus TaxID=6339 RepID=A0A183G5J1_HELPZ|nr:unnamed protein product [Heligmosomoides polygyrus]